MFISKAAMLTLVDASGGVHPTGWGEIVSWVRRLGREGTWG